MSDNPPGVSAFRCPGQGSDRAGPCPAHDLGCFLNELKARLAEMEQGRDPSAQRHEARAALTVDELCGQYLEAARAGLVLTRFRKPKRPRTIYDDEGRVLRHIKPLIRNLVAANPPLTAAVVQRMADAIAAGKTAGTFQTKSRGVAKVAGGAAAAARTVELFGGVWSWAERRGLGSGPNPARGVEKHKGDAKERFLNPDELARLGAALREQEATQPAAVAALRLIASLVCAAKRRAGSAGARSTRRWGACAWRRRGLE